MKSSSRENKKELKKNPKVDYDKKLKKLIIVYQNNKEKLDNLNSISWKEYKNNKKEIKLCKKEYKQKIKNNIIEISKIRNIIDEINNS